MSDSGKDLFTAVQDWVAHELRGERPSSLDYPRSGTRAGAPGHRDPRGDLTVIGLTLICD
jgi:hypothetical protein